MSRRTLLAGSVAVAAGAGIAAAGGQLLAGVEWHRGLSQGDRPDRAHGARADRSRLGRTSPPTGRRRFITPNRDFYRVDINLTLPQLRAEDWRLRMHGMVDREVTLNWADLTSRPLIERPVTMTCVSNEVGGPYISTANFTGVLLADILKEAGVRRGADQVFTTSVDGWTCGTPTAALTDPARQAMLVIGMNGEPLPIEHGFPVRMLVPGLYGFVSGTKWITDMELTTFDAKRAYWLQRGWGQRAPIKTMSRIDSPGAFGRVGADSRRSPVSRGRRPRASRKSRYASTTASGNPRSCPLRSTWTRGGCSGCGDGGNPGAHVAEVRATDKTGYTQTADRAAPIPDGASGWHSVQFTVLSNRKP